MVSTTTTEEVVLKVLELLIDQKIESKFIKKIHCHSQETVDFVNNNLKPHNDYIKAVNIEINSNAFF